MSKKVRIIQYTVIICAAIFLLFPIATLFVTVSKTNAWVLFSSISFRQAIINSIVVSLTASFISIALGFITAMIIVKVDLVKKPLFNIMFTLPMLIPSISHGIGLVILLGNSGIITNTFHLSGNIYGFWGIVIGSVFYSFPVSYIMLKDILQYDNHAAYVAADTLCVSKWHQIKDITLPFIKRPLVTIFFTIFTMVITDYGVPLMIGGRYMTLPTIMYQDVIGLLDFGKGSLIGLILMVPAIVAFVLDFRKQKPSDTENGIKPRLNNNPAVKNISLIFCLFLSLIILMPIAAFMVLAIVKQYPLNFSLTFDHFNQVIQRHGLYYLKNSLIIAFSTGLIGMIFIFISAYLAQRYKSISSKIIHLLSIITMAIPGLVLGLGYLTFFKGSVIFGTLAIIIFANILHFFASPYLMIYNILEKMNQNIEVVGEILGVSRLRIIWDVIIPLVKNTLVEVFVYLFVNSMMTISAVAFLANIFTKPLALLIPSFEGQMMLEAASIVSLIILVINLLIKISFMLINKYILGEKKHETKFNTI